MKVINIKKYACLVIGLAVLSNCLKPTFHRGKTSVASSSSPSSAASTAAATVDFVLGQADFTSDLNVRNGMYRSIGITTCGTRLIVADTGNGRVLIWNTIPTSTQTTPDVVLGESSLDIVVSQSASAQNIDTPRGVYCDGTRLFVVDYTYHRVLIWNSIPTSNYASADVVLGQPNFTSSTANNGGIGSGTLNGPTGVYSDGTKLFVTDNGNNRVLIWNSIPTSNQAAANVVLGQPNFTSSTANNGGIGSGTLNGPAGVYSDGTKLFVADYSNHRVLIWNSIPTSNQAAADVVLGQPNFTSNTASNGGITSQSLDRPIDVYSNGTRLFVSVYNHHRVLIWNSIPTSNQVAADVVLGQPVFTSNTANNGGIGSGTLNNPWGINSDGTRLFVADYNNHRILIWNTLPTSNQAAADIVLGQPNMTSNQLNNNGVNSKSFAYDYAGAASVYSDGSKIFVADYSNNRVLIWNSIPTSNQVAADVVLGQPNFTSNTANNGGIGSGTLNGPAAIYSDGTRLFVADTDNNRVLIWNSVPTSNQVAADVVLGQPNMTSNTANGGGISAQTLRSPDGVYSDGSKVFVSDWLNHRVLIWNSMPTLNQAAANVVLGQPNFTSSTANNGGIGSGTLNAPWGIHSDGTRLFVTDFSNNRVLIWNSIPTSNQAAANVVLGQPNFTSNTANNGGVSAQSMYNPATAFSDGTKLFVTEWNNHRVLIWNSIPTSNQAAADTVYGQPSMTSNTAGLALKSLNYPTAACVYGARLVIGDMRNSRLLLVPVP